MEFEAVGGISVSNLGFEIGGQVYDINCAKGAFLRTDTTADTQSLRDVGNF